MSTVKRSIGFEEFCQKADDLAKDILKNQVSYDLLLCVTRGGLTLTDSLSRKLNIKNIRTIACSSYDKGNQQGETINFDYGIPFMGDMDYRKILIVDDLIDSGKTLNAIIAKLQEQAPNARYDIAVLVTKKAHTPITEAGHIYAAEIDLPRDQRIQFYYEGEEE